MGPSKAEASATYAIKQGELHVSFPYTGWHKRIVITIPKVKS